MKKKLFTCAVLVAALFFTACHTTPVVNNQMKNPPKHVFLIAFDGLSSYSINHNAEMPTFRSLMADGSYTTENRTVLPSSSAANWASMYCGVGPELHGYNTCCDEKPSFPPRELNEHGVFPDIFYQIRLKHPEAETAHFYEWGGMYFLADKEAINRVEQVGLSGDDTDGSVKPVVEYIKEKKPDFCAVIFAEPDGSGHGYGWKSKEYFAKLTHLDKALKKLVDAIDEAGIRDESVIILAADHGGIETSHGGITMDEMQTTIVFNGKGIKKGFQLPESTMVYDIASTIGYMFGIDQPQVWIGRPVKSIFTQE